jgi:hypothetical protein
MIWTPERNAEQSTVVSRLYAAAAEVPCQRQAIVTGGLPRSNGAAPPRSPARTCPATSLSASKVS